jgi:hypothetical protein
MDHDSTDVIKESEEGEWEGDHGGEWDHGDGEWDHGDSGDWVPPEEMKPVIIAKVWKPPPVSPPASPSKATPSLAKSTGSLKAASKLKAAVHAVSLRPTNMSLRPQGFGMGMKRTSGGSVEQAKAKAIRDKEEAEAKAKMKAEKQTKKDAEEKTRKEEAEKARKEIEEKTKTEAKQQAKKGAEDKANKPADNSAKTAKVQAKEKEKEKKKAEEPAEKGSQVQATEEPAEIDVLPAGETGGCAGQGGACATCVVS